MMPPLIAALGPDDHPYLAYAILGGIIAIAAVARNIIGAVKDWNELKAQKTGGDFATQAQLREVHDRVDQVFLDHGKMRGEITASINTMGDRFAESLRTISEQMGGIQRSLGRVEGLEGIIREHGADIDQLQGRPAKHSRGGGA